jgi:AcrR family transcriptional regulator
VGRGEIHDSDTILDAARDLVLERGVAGATVRGIAERAGAPTGSLYHRFGSRDGVLARMWIRAVERSQHQFLSALANSRTADDRAVAAALSVFDFARDQPKDAQVVVLFRREDVIRTAPEELEPTLRALNEPVIRAIRRLAEGRSFDEMLLAVFDLPYGAVRRHLVRGKAPPKSLRSALERAVRAVLSG